MASHGGKPSLGAGYQKNQQFVRLTNLQLSDGKQGIEMSTAQKDGKKKNEQNRRLVIYGLIYSFGIGTVTVLLMALFLFHIPLLKAVVATTVFMTAVFILYWISHRCFS